MRFTEFQVNNEEIYLVIYVYIDIHIPLYLHIGKDIISTKPRTKFFYKIFKRNVKSVSTNPIS